MPAYAGFIEVEALETYDTGNRIGSGAWSIGARTSMKYYNFLGYRASTTWQAQLWINSVADGGLLVGTGQLEFESDQWSQSVTAIADFQTCYQGKAYASAGGDTEHLGGNHVCTDPEPPPNPRPGGGDPIHGDTPQSDWFDPLILDLNGDGIHTTGLDAPVVFDLDGDGAAETITWTNAATEEGFLWIELDGKNRVDGGSELFGIGTVLPSGAKARDGFEALAAYDETLNGGDGDGVITASDAVWNRLRVWIDRDHDAQCDPDERAPIHRYGVRALRLSAQPDEALDSAGNRHPLRGEYARRAAGEAETHALHAIAFRRVR